MAESLHNSGIKSLSQVPWPGELRVQAGPPVRALVHPRVHTPHPSRPASGAEATYSTSLWRAEGSQARRSVQAQVLVAHGKGRSVQSDAQEANFNQEPQSDLGPEGKPPAEVPPDSTLVLPEGLRPRLGTPCPPAFPSSQAMLSAHGQLSPSPHQSSVICLQTPWDWLPSAPTASAAHGDLVAQGPS